ncbi:hypothetical protein HYW21_02490 [Candidatus Woesearchaeota archaeon]|nr:hypothetical protein [Candidatus Woesearchaeota archaeon]
MVASQTNDGQKEIQKNEENSRYLWITLRLGMAWIFLWPFFDKLFGLGFSTPSDKAWVLGTSPTNGFLAYATKGPFASMYQSIAGNVVVDWIFMIGLLCIGLALLFGVGMRIAAYSGSLMLFLMWTAVLPPEHNPFLDDHLIYILVLLILATVKAGQWFGLGRWWTQQAVVQKYPILE